MKNLSPFLLPENFHTQQYTQRPQGQHLCHSVTYQNAGVIFLLILFISYATCQIKQLRNYQERIRPKRQLTKTYTWYTA